MAADASIFTQEYAFQHDEQDPLRHLRQEFVIPSQADLKAQRLDEQSEASSEPCTYLCGNSLGVQPRRTKDYVDAQLKTWATKGVHGHFTRIQDSPLTNWLDMDEAASQEMARIVGARQHEVSVMQTLTANLHFLMAAFYRPTRQRYKIILESKAFPSDHFAVESQLAHHGYNSSKAMVLLNAPDDSPDDSPLLPTEHILSVIDKHADSTALLLLPGIQFYTGQYFDIPTITAHAQSKGIVVGWDLAHAAGNVPVQLHDWNVDFAAWCTYKYLNCGPGAIGALFVNDRHAPPDDTDGSNGQGQKEERHRLTGWWGSSKASRFNMDNHFQAMGGAAGFQLSNPSALDLSAVAASLSIFAQTDMQTLREKSLKLTKYLEELLLHEDAEHRGSYRILTPTNPSERGAQLSILLKPGILDTVMRVLDSRGVVLDERKPDVIRVAPAPLYNNHGDVLRFYQCFREALAEADKEQALSK